MARPSPHRDERGSSSISKPPPPGTKVSGAFVSTARGLGFVVPEKGDYGDIKVPIAATGQALHGDHVQVEIQRSRPGDQPIGAVVKVLRHANQQFVGRISHRGRFSTVIPKNPKINRVLEVHRRIDPEEIPDEAWVVAEVTRWSDSPRDPLLGKISEVLGIEGDKGLPILLLIRAAGVPSEFSEKVVGEAEALTREPDDADPQRRDFRNDCIYTIDPATAKDFDDAVGLISFDEKGWRVGVHIADVAYFVRPGTELDAEAYARATSIYPVDRVIPMLPEALSNQLCSLREGEEKLTMSALFTVTPAGKIRDVELCNSRIRSVRRFTYEEAQGVFDAADLAAGIEIEEEREPYPAPEISSEIRSNLLRLRLASQALSAARSARGSLDLELPEPQFVIDADGIPTGLTHSEHFEAHKFIEELMVAANEAVAQTLEKNHFPALYRVHEEPKPSRAKEIAPALARVGIVMPIEGSLSREQLQAVLDQAKSHPAARIIQQWVLRTLMRARYQPENLGHFGLASESYLHFTSPIRRYPDLIVHRIVKKMLAGAKPGDPEIEEIREHLPEWGRHTTKREELSQKIEWDAEAIMALDYMRRNHLGDVFDAFVSGVNPMGFFVSFAEYPVEGLVRIASIPDEYFDLDEDYHIWRSRQSGSMIAMGDAVTVAIERIDVLGGQMDLRLVRRKKGPGPGAQPKSKAKGKGKGKGKGKFGAPSKGGFRPPPAKRKRR